MIDYHMFQAETREVGYPWKEAVKNGVSPLWIYEVLQRAARAEVEDQAGANKTQKIWKKYQKTIEALNLSDQEKGVVSRNAARHTERFKKK